MAEPRRRADEVTGREEGADSLFRDGGKRMSGQYPVAKMPREQSLCLVDEGPGTEEGADSLFRDGGKRMSGQMR